MPWTYQRTKALVHPVPGSGGLSVGEGGKGWPLMPASVQTGSPSPPLLGPSTALFSSAWGTAPQPCPSSAGPSLGRPRTLASASWFLAQASSHPPSPTHEKLLPQWPFQSLATQSLPPVIPPPTVPPTPPRTRHSFPASPPGNPQSSLQGHCSSQTFSVSCQPEPTLAHPPAFCPGHIPVELEPLGLWWESSGCPWGGLQGLS